jgi:uncharacterized phage protein gp47/JayE
MAFDLPSLQSLVTQAIRAINANLPGADAALRRNNLYPTGKVLANLVRGLYEYGDYVRRQYFVRLCDDDTLDLHGAQMRPPVPRLEPTKAAGLLDLYANSACAIKIGDRFIRSDNVAYEALEPIVLDGGSAGSLRVQAVVAGSAGNLTPAAALTCRPILAGSSLGVPGVEPVPLASPIADLVAAAGQEGLTGGTDREQREAYRQRLLFARAFPDHAGAPPDYVRYARGVSGVTRVFVEPGYNGRGTVGIYPMLDDLNLNGIPSSDDLARVSNAVRYRAPGAATIYCAAAVPQLIYYTLSGLGSLSTDDKNRIETELRAMLARRGRVAGNAVPHPSMPFLATPLTVPRQWVRDTVASVTGSFGHQVVAPTSDTIIERGCLPVLGGVIFT